MPWSEVSVTVDREQAPLAELVLEQQDALAITLEDDEDHPVFEPGPGATPLWPRVHVRGLFEAGVSRDGITLATAICEPLSPLGAATTGLKPGEAVPKVHRHHAKGVTERSVAISIV